MIFNSSKNAHLRASERGEAISYGFHTFYRYKDKFYLYIFAQTNGVRCLKRRYYVCSDPREFDLLTKTPLDELDDAIKENNIHHERKQKLDALSK
jgi:hypothetical protein